MGGTINTDTPVSISTPVPCPFRFTDLDVGVHKRDYARTVAGLMKCHAQDYELDDKAFADSLLEIEKDLNIFHFRRLKNGVSLGKQAGVFIFRLARTPIVHVAHPERSQGVAQQVNAAAAFCFACWTIKLKPSQISDSIRREILYNLCSRHTNQETLGIIFDAVLAR